MYDLPYFKEKDKDVLLDFIRKYPFAFISGCDDEGKPVATQIPVFIEERNEGLFLTGHMMKQQDHHKAFEKNPHTLCVFTGPHCYVSATWYKEPNRASTWNYMSVHVKGKMNFLDEESLIDVLRKTSLHFEGMNKDSATVYDNLPEDYRTRLLKAIVAFEVEVEEMDHVFKLSQNHDSESFESVIAHLQKGDASSQSIAEEMIKRRK
jgi:transcriptional regulator